MRNKFKLFTFFFFKKNETDVRIARKVEDSINLGIDVAFKLIKIPIYVGINIIWKLIKVPLKFIWDLSKVPFRVIAKIACKLSKRPLKAITPMFLQKIVRDVVEDYRVRKLPKKLKKSHIYRAGMRV